MIPIYHFRTLIEEEEEKNPFQKFPTKTPQSFEDSTIALHHATDGVTLGIQPGECFGLLGPNGAGKTTLFNMVTGNATISGPDAGSIKIFGKDAYQDQFETARQNLGLVPQQDCLSDGMTGFEHLRLYSQMTGTYWGKAAPNAKKDGNLHEDPMNNDPQEETAPLIMLNKDVKPKPLLGEERIAAFLALVGLSPEDAARPAGTYSGGMRRKLSVACTLITDPKLLFLDEMSAGVDIVAQRTLWRLLVNRPKDQTIVSTTHSMLEADSTCDRIGILVSGKLRCLGDAAR